MPLFSSVKDKLVRKASAHYDKATANSRGNPYQPGLAPGPFPPGPPPPNCKSTSHLVNTSSITNMEALPKVAPMPPGPPLPPAMGGPGYDAPPPGYTPGFAPGYGGAPEFSTGYAPSPQPMASSNASSDNDPYAFLSKFDTIILIDDSGSMAGSRWREAATALTSITSICTAHDKDGIDLYFLNHKSGAPAPAGKAKDGYYNVADPRSVENIFNIMQPSGRTFTGTRIESILKPYIAQLSRARDMSDVKPINLIVITDGHPNDDPESVIVQHARKLDSLEAPLYQVGIQFFQIGQSREARDALRDLDDGLAELGIRDMVDTATFDAEDHSSNKVLSADGILKVVLGAVVRRLDRKPTAGGNRRR